MANNNKSTVGQKRKRKILTLESKVEVIERFDKGETVSSLVKIFNLGDSTIRDIIKSRNKLLEFTRSNDSPVGLINRKTMKTAKYKNLDDEMTKWYLNKRADGYSVNGPMCLAKAQEFHKLLSIKGPFNASSGWLHRFKNRHGIQSFSQPFEPIPSDRAHKISIKEDVNDHENEEKDEKLQVNTLVNKEDVKKDLESVVSQQDAIKHVNGLLEYLEQQSDNDSSLILKLKKLKKSLKDN